jgi:hypothetical protein
VSNNENNDAIKGSVEVVEGEGSVRKAGKINYETIKYAIYEVDNKLIAVLYTNRHILTHSSHLFTWKVLQGYICVRISCT